MILLVGKYWHEVPAEDVTATLVVVAASVLSYLLPAVFAIIVWRYGASPWLGWAICVHLLLIGLRPWSNWTPDSDAVVWPLLAVAANLGFALLAWMVTTDERGRLTNHLARALFFVTAAFGVTISIVQLVIFEPDFAGYPSIYAVWPNLELFETVVVPAAYIVSWFFVIGVAILLLQEVIHASPDVRAARIAQFGVYIGCYTVYAIGQIWPTSPLAEGDIWWALTEAVEVSVIPGLVGWMLWKTYHRRHSATTPAGFHMSGAP